MDQKLSLDKLLKSKIISQRTYDKVKIAKEYIENKYNLKSLASNKLTNILQNIKNLNINEEEKLKIIKEINDIQIQKIRKNREKQTIREYESLSIIGRGAFGEVHVCREIKTGKIYAVKKIKKDVLLEKNQIIHIRSEQQFMSKVKSPWIVDLKASFQEDDYLYLIMEFCQGGDFMNLLIKKDILMEEEARFYTAELILAVESIHKLDCIHRDIKPDNILIDKNGHIKLSDFGLAKISEKLVQPQNFKNSKNRPTHQKNYSCVGTAYYVAPEVLKKTGYSEDIDWWSVGVILFEMLVGYAPFCSEKTKDVCYKVLNWKEFLKIPEDVIISPEAEDLIAKMVNDSDKRLGKNGVDEIKAHPFFKKIDWNNIRNTKAPFIPDIKNDYDTKYFDKFDYIEDFYPPIKKFKKRKDAEFLGYTYREENGSSNDIYDDEDEINKIYQDILEKYQINNNNNDQRNKNEIKNNNFYNNLMVSLPLPNQKKEINNKKNKVSIGDINYQNQNMLLNKNKNLVYVKNQNKLNYSQKNKKENSPPLYNKININKNILQNQGQQKPLKTIKICYKRNNASPNLHLAKSFNNSKIKYIKTKLGQNNNFNNKNQKIRLSPIPKNKNMKISLNNSQKKINGNRINTKKIKIQDIKLDISMENMKANKLSLNKSFKL